MGLWRKRRNNTIFTYGGGAWTPAALSPIAWFHASVAYITESGGAVSDWADRSGNGQHVTQAVAGSKPAWSATGWDGASKGAVTFDGGDQLRRSDPTALICTAFDGDDAPVSVFATIEPNTPTVELALCAWENNAGNESSACRFDNQTTEWHMRYSRRGNGEGLSQVDGSGLVTPAKHVVGYMFNGSTVTSYFDGTLDLNGAAINVATMSFDFFSIGAFSDVGATYRGKLAELVIVAGALTVTEYNLYRTWAASEWGGLP